MLNGNRSSQLQHVTSYSWSSFIHLDPSNDHNNVEPLFSIRYVKGKNSFQSWLWNILIQWVLSILGQVNEYMENIGYLKSKVRGELRGVRSRIITIFIIMHSTWTIPGYKVACVINTISLWYKGCLQMNNQKSKKRICLKLNYFSFIAWGIIGPIKTMTRQRRMGKDFNWTGDQHTGEFTDYTRNFETISKAQTNNYNI